MDPHVTSTVLFRAFDLFIKIVRLSAVSTSLEAISELIRKSACKFQLRYANYQFECARRHKAFKEARNDQKPLEEIREKYDALQVSAEKGVKLNCGDIADQIRDYFTITHRHKIAPRVGIYAIDDSNQVVDIVKTPNGSPTNPKLVGGYTAFMNVCNSGLPYLANNLPLLIKKAPRVVHAGLDVSKIRTDYSPRWRDRKFFARIRNNLLKNTSRDEEWCNLSAQPLPNPEHQLYKSHLVVPITFRAHAERSILNQQLVDILRLPENGRSILGFVIVDHPSTYYFDEGDVVSFENIDINMLYFFADMLSLFFVTSLTYTSGSTTVGGHRTQERSNQ